MNEEFKKWYDERPDCIKQLIDKLPPTNMYRLKATGQRGYLYSYSENNTVTMNFPWGLNWDGRCVFGINPDDLEVCTDVRPVTAVSQKTKAKRKAKHD